jgi:hypothetical protein
MDHDQADSAPQSDDWLDRICPYLLSEDGTYRSSQPDAGHRCTAQEPPSSLPMAFQERYCLSERHHRCEMFKVAQSARAAAFDREGIPVEQVRAARFRPSVRSVPLALGPSSSSGSSRGRDSRRTIIAAGIGILGLAILAFLLVLLVTGGGGSGPGAISSPSPGPSEAASSAPTGVPSAPPEPTLEPTTAEPTSVASLAPSEAPATDGPRIEYEVQEGEALIAIAATFGTSRREILLANPEMAEQRPYTEPGDLIIVPVAADMAASDIEAVPGFVRYLK